jgi:hypothetical protein
MPSSKSAGVLEYTVAHEWGHTQAAVDDPKIDEIFNAKDPKMSSYGRTGSQEAYAEAFAEFSLTGGNTPNKTVQKYAATFGWK